MIRQAIVLAGDHDAGSFAPHSVRVAGLTMLKRTLAMLQWAGVTETCVVVGPWDRGASRRSLDGDRDLNPARMQLRWVTDVDAPARGGLAVSKAIRHVRGQVLVVRADTVYDKGILTTLAASDPALGSAVVATDNGTPIGMALCDRTAIVAFNGYTFDQAVAAFEGQDRLRTSEVGGRFWVRVTDAASARRATDVLWNSCRKPIDGIVSRHLNRNVSLFISRRIAHLPIAPNHVSMLTFALGIATAYCVAQGGYGWFLLGAALFKANSILDGVDGELARVKYKMSVLGEWLDTLSDDLSNLMFFVGLTIGAYRMTGSQTWVSLGMVTAILFLFASAYQYSLLLRSGRGDLLAIRWVFERGEGKGDGQRSHFAALLNGAKYLIKKDFFVALIFVVALVGVLPYMLYLSAAANVVLFATIIGQEVVLYRQRRAGVVVERVLASPAAAAASAPALERSATVG